MNSYVGAVLSSALLIFCINVPATAEVYKCQGDDGVVKYSPKVIQGCNCRILPPPPASTARLTHSDLYTEKFDPEAEARLATEIFQRENVYIQARTDLLTTGKSAFVEKELSNLGLESDKEARQVLSGMIVDGSISPELMRSILQGYALTRVFTTSLKSKYTNKASSNVNQESATPDALKLDSLYAFINVDFQLVHHCILDTEAFIKFIQNIEEMNPSLTGHLTAPLKMAAIHNVKEQCASNNYPVTSQSPDRSTATSGSYDDVFRPGSILNPIHVIVH